MLYEPGWDKKEANKLRELGLTQEQIGIIIGIIADHRMRADLQGYNRGYEKGYNKGIEKRTIKKR